MTRLSKLVAYGQSCWLDDLSRRMLQSGELAARVGLDGVRGVTSNPAIFERSINNGGGYDGQIAQLSAQGFTPAQIYENLAITDIRAACDLLRPVYDQTNGADGFVSLEVSPHLAHDTQGSIEEGRRLSTSVARPNLFIKIPGTAAGVPAIEELLFLGINVNITLLFSQTSYDAVAQAYMRALERRLTAGLSVDGVASVASFFLSRIDTLVDRLLSHRNRDKVVGLGQVDPRALSGQVAVANAKLAYRHFRHLHNSDRWRALAERGARVQRLLWASTGAKNPKRPDLMYVEPLIGPHTVSTMPLATLAAFLDHGTVQETAEFGVEAAENTMADLARLGIDFDVVARQLEDEGVEKFIAPYDALMEKITAKSERFRHAGDIAPLGRMADRLRRMVIEMTSAAGSGHPTSCLSCADIVAALFFSTMRWDPGDPSARNVDSFILSKGHAAPILWAALHEAGALHEDPLSLRRLDSSLEGHPTAANPWIRIATGSLGQGLAAANGIAAANRLDGIDARVFCLLGDGECSEGSVWEAAQFASLNHLSNVVAIVDVNGLGQSEAAPYGQDTAVLARRFQAFGWQAIEIDGHDLHAILDALRRQDGGKPVAIIARTVKGKGVSFLEGAPGWHGKALDAAQKEKALAELDAQDVHLPVPARRIGDAPADHPAATPAGRLDYRPGAAIATREAYGKALARLASHDPRIVALDGDVKNSTGTEIFAQSCPARFFQAYIAEQSMVGAALGLASAGKIPFATTFACFLTRAYDFIRMAEYSRPAHLVLCGSHAGVSIGEDGPSQMGLEDVAMFRALINTTVLQPCDAVSAERLTEAAVECPGIVYLRTTRAKMPVIYGNDEAFPVGGSKVLRSSPQDRFTLVAAGITVHEALAAHEELARHGVPVRVIDAYSIKPLDTDTLARAAEETQGLFVVEDHAVLGGLGEAVAASVGTLAPVIRLGIGELPHSGKKDELLERYGISHRAIEERVMALAA